MVDTIGRGGRPRRLRRRRAPPPADSKSASRAPRPPTASSCRRVEATPGVSQSEAGLALPATARWGCASASASSSAFVDPGLADLAPAARPRRPFARGDRAGREGGGGPAASGVGDTIELRLLAPRAAGERGSRVRVSGIARKARSGRSPTWTRGAPRDSGPRRPRRPGDARARGPDFRRWLSQRAPLRPSRASPRCGRRPTQPNALKRTVDSFSGAIQMVVAITLALGLLVAFTSASASVDERRREYATLFAFGLPVRSRPARGGRRKPRDRGARRP